MNATWSSAVVSTSLDSSFICNVKAPVIINIRVLWTTCEKKGTCVGEVKSGRSVVGNVARRSRSGLTVCAYISVGNRSCPRGAPNPPPRNRQISPGATHCYCCCYLRRCILKRRAQIVNQNIWICRYCFNT